MKKVEHRFDAIKDKVLNPLLKDILSTYMKSSEYYNTYSGSSILSNLLITHTAQFNDANSLSVLAFMQGGKYNEVKGIPIKTQDLSVGKAKIYEDDCPECPSGELKEKTDIPEIGTIEVKIDQLDTTVISEKSVEIKTEKVVQTKVKDKVQTKVEEVELAILTPDSPEEIMSFFDNDKSRLLVYANEVLNLKLPNNTKIKTIAVRIYKHLKDELGTD